MRKIKPGITIDPEVWKQFKKKYKGAISKEIENLMRLSLSSETKLKTQSSENISSLILTDPKKWSVSFSDDNLKIQNTCFNTNESSSISYAVQNDIIIT
jgi:hypothetical protein